MTPFDTPGKQAFWKHCGNEQFLLFLQFSTCSDNYLQFLSNLKLSSANSFSLEESKICRLVMGQPWSEKHNKNIWDYTIKSPIFRVQKACTHFLPEHGSQLIHRSCPLVLCISFRLGGSVVSMSDTWPCGCEFDTRLRQIFFQKYFRLTSAEVREKSIQWLSKESCVSTVVRKPENT